MSTTHVPLGTLGEIVSWRAPKEVRFVDLQAAMKTAGIDEKLLREMLPRHAFSRAARKLAEGRIIRQVEENDTTITFQFTKEHLKGNQYEYALETHLKLDKATGGVDCPIAGLQTMAKGLVDGEMAVRKATDVSRLVQRTFEISKGDLIPIREQGGVYFIPETHVELADRIDELLRACGGGLRRFKVSADGASTSKSVAEAMNEHFLQMIGEFKSSCDEIVTGEASPTIAKRRSERVRELRVKLGAYKDILQDYAEQIEKGIDEADSDLKKKLGIADDKPSGETAQPKAATAAKAQAATSAPVVSSPDLDLDSLVLPAAATVNAAPEDPMSILAGLTL